MPQKAALKLKTQMSSLLYINELGAERNTKWLNNKYRDASR